MVKCPNHVAVVCSLGSAASLRLTPPPTMGGWMARKCFPYPSHLGTCMGLGFGGVTLLLDNTSVPSVCFLSCSVARGVAKLQMHVISERGWWSHSVPSSQKKTVQPGLGEVGLTG